MGSRRPRMAEKGALPAGAILTRSSDWATSPSVQRVNHGVSGVLDSWWDMAATVSPPGLMSDIGFGPEMRDPLPKLDRAMRGHASSSNADHNPRVPASVAQIGVGFSPPRS